MGRLRSLFFGSLLRTAFSTVLVLVVAAVVVVAVGVATGVFGVPAVEETDNRIGSWNDTDTVIDTDIRVDNPNPVGISLGGVSADYEVLLNDVRMANGTKDGVSIGSGESTVSLQTRMKNDRIPEWWVSHVENDEETTLSVEGNVSSSLLGQSTGLPPVERSVSTDIVGALDSTKTRPISIGNPVVDPVVYLNETSGTWGSVNDSATEIEMEFVVYNPQATPVPVSELGYDLTMNGITMGSGQSEDVAVLGPGETTTVRTTTVLRNENLDEWWVSHLEEGQVTTLKIAFYTRFDLPELAETAEIPLDSVDHRLETDIFGNKNETGN